METLRILRTNFIPKVGKLRVIYSLREEVKDFSAEIFILFEHIESKMDLRGVVVKRNIQDLLINALANFSDDNDIRDYKTEFVNADVNPLIHENIEQLLQENYIDISRTQIDLHFLVNYNIAVLIDVKKRFPEVFNNLENLTKSTILKHYINLVRSHTLPQIEEIS